jgi:mersacidin/lichenicidin family type 2 lantibiotic
MSKVDIIRAWKDEDYRASLTEAERALLPPHPAGLIQLDDEQMKAFFGAGSYFSCAPRCVPTLIPVPCG